MSLLKKLFGLAVVAAVFVGVADAATVATSARPSIIATTSARLPSIAAIIGKTATAGTTVTTTTQEYIDRYIECLKDSAVCGENFEECTNKTLFFAKKAACSSTLLTMPSAALSSLYGSATTTAYANKNSDGEYTYPGDGSVLGQMIAAAHIGNRYDTSDCVRRYTTCLKKDDVCGADFELCTSNAEFKKQKLFCESTLARCQNDGLSELFGTTTTSANPTNASRIGIMINEGAALAAVNAVATCYKVADTCILNACAGNPYKCKEGASVSLSDATDAVNAADAGTAAPTTATDSMTGAVNRNEISGFVRKSCIDTIGANQFCYATFIGEGKMPTGAQLNDENNKSEVYAAAYSSRMNDSMRSKIDDLIERFDARTKQRCRDTIVQCAMKSCGEGSGVACYASAFAAGGVQSVTNAATLPGIKSGCEHIVNNDTNCKYAGATFDMTTGAIMFADTSLFDRLFTDANDTAATLADPVSAVAELNSKLSLSYSQAALDNMKKQCQSVASSCIRSMCGTDFENCYRNRTDVYSTLTTSDESAFNKSMNKVGGVLDHTIVLGLCVDTVRNSNVCQEHLSAEAARAKAGRETTNTWGGGSVGSQWLGAGNLDVTGTDTSWVDTDANGNELCTASAAGCGQAVGICNESFRTGNTTCLYDTRVMLSMREYDVKQAEQTMFSTLVGDIEAEVQAIYNAKLTKQQNMCMQGAANGIIGNRDSGGTFMWVKLRSNRIANDYAVNGLKVNQFVASSDIYNSFCRIRVTLQSDDKAIQAKIASGSAWSTAYFAAGDAFTCGSWIPNDALEDIARGVAAEETNTNANGRLRNGQGWAVAGTTLLGVLGGGAGGLALSNAIQDKGLGGLLGKGGNKTTANSYESNKTICVEYARRYVSEQDSVTGDRAIDAGRQLLGNSNTAVTEAREYKDIFDRDTTAENNERDAIAKMQALSTACQNAQDNSAGGGDGAKTTAGDWIGLGVGAAVGGVTLGVGTAQIIKANNRAKFDAAQQEWMDQVGGRIRCYIGGDEVGTYGDMISTEIE